MKSRLRGVGIALTAFIVAPVAAHAADRYVPYKAPPTVAAYNWTGCYAGVHVGAGIHDSDQTNSPGYGNPGAVAGGQIGCDYQIRQFVVGLEAAGWWSGLKTTSTDNENLSPTFTDNFTAQTKNLWDATFAMRAGFAFDRALFYGKIGYAVGRFNWSSSEVERDTLPPPISSTRTSTASATQQGLILGAGLEYAFTDQLSALFEYNYIQYSDSPVTFANTSCATGQTPTCFSSNSTVDSRQRLQIVKIGLNYRFGGGTVSSQY
jgi:outer membrane immunogenic protein